MPDEIVAAVHEAALTIATSKLPLTAFAHYSEGRWRVALLSPSGQLSLAQDARELSEMLRTATRMRRCET